MQKIYKVHKQFDRVEERSIVINLVLTFDIKKIFVYFVFQILTHFFLLITLYMQNSTG